MGVSFEVYIFQHLQLGGGVGIFSYGGHIDYYFWNITKTSPNLSLGFSTIKFASLFSYSYNINTLWLGFHSTDENFKFSAYAGPAHYQADYSDPTYSIYGGLTIGYRF